MPMNSAVDLPLRMVHHAVYILSDVVDVRQIAGNPASCLLDHNRAVTDQLFGKVHDLRRQLLINS